MVDSCKWMYILVIIFAVEVEPYSFEAKEKESTNSNQPVVASTLKRIKESAPTLLKLLQAILEIVWLSLWIIDSGISGVLWLLNETVSSCTNFLVRIVSVLFNTTKLLQTIWEIVLLCLWIIDSGINGFLWLLNETVSSCTNFLVRIFGVLLNIVKLLEALGYGIKFLLELNYEVLSCIFKTLGGIRESFHHVVTIVKITIANETDHVYESSSMALEGVQNLFLSACNQTWASVQYMSTIVASNLPAPFGLSALDTDLMASIFLSGIKFFVESIKMTVQVFTDGNLFILNFFHESFLKVGSKSVHIIMAALNFIQETVATVTYQTTYVFTWPFYFLVSILSNISCMLLYSWDAFVKWLSYLDTSVRELMYLILQTAWLIITGFVDSTAGFINTYFPGGLVGCIVLTFVVIAVFAWHDKIKSLIESSWLSVREFNVYATPNVHVQVNQQPFGNEDIDTQGTADLNAQNVTEPAFDAEVRENQTKLRHELELEKDKRMCIICQNNVKNILLLPCRHVCMCQQCLRQIRYNVRLAQCPLCRQQIQSTLEVFV